MTEEEKAQLLPLLSVIDMNLHALDTPRQEKLVLEAMDLHRRTMTCHHPDGRRKTVDEINRELGDCVKVLAFNPKGKGH